jgi:exosome complex component RRP42
MAPPTSTTQVLLSPAELSYLHTSLSLTPPIRPDARSGTQFRPVTAECDVLPGTNGSARICFADGTEAIVGVKAEVEKTAAAAPSYGADGTRLDPGREAEGDGDGDDGGVGVGVGAEAQCRGDGWRGENAWVELTVEIPGFRDDDAMPVFLAALLSEALLADGEFTGRLWINRRFHWKLYIDVCLVAKMVWFWRR